LKYGDAHVTTHDTPSPSQLRVLVLLLSMGARGTQRGLLGGDKAAQAVKDLRVVAWPK